MSSAKDIPDTRPPLTPAKPGSKAVRRPARPTKGTVIRVPRLVGALDIAGIPTMVLVKELERRGRLAMRLAIEDALNPVNDGNLRLSTRHGGNEGNAETLRE